MTFIKQLIQKYAGSIQITGSWGQMGNCFSSWNLVQIPGLCYVWHCKVPGNIQGQMTGLMALQHLKICQESTCSPPVSLWQNSHESQMALNSQLGLKGLLQDRCLGLPARVQHGPVAPEGPGGKPQAGTPSARAHPTTRRKGKGELVKFNLEPWSLRRAAGVRQVGCQARKSICKLLSTRSTAGARLETSRAQAKNNLKVLLAWWQGCGWRPQPRLVMALRSC